MIPECCAVERMRRAESTMAELQHGRGRPHQSRYARQLPRARGSRCAGKPFAARKEEAAGRIRGRTDECTGTAPPRRTASSPVAGQGACCRGGFDPPTPTEGPFCSAQALPIREIAARFPLRPRKSEGPFSASPVHAERRRTSASKPGDPFTGTFSALPSVNQAGNCLVIAGRRTNTVLPPRRRLSLTGSSTRSGVPRLPFLLSGAQRQTSFTD